MADFPNTIYNPRETENLPGVVYDPANKQNFYSEDFQNQGGEIEAIETWLQNNSIINGQMINGKIVPSVSSNNLTLALKTLAGADPSATDPVFSNINGVVHKITSALSVTKNAGINWFNAGSSGFATLEVDYFAYLGYNATDGVVIGFSRICHACKYSDFNTTNTNDKYCAISTITNADANDPYSVIGRFSAILSASATYNWSVPTFTASNLIQNPIFETRVLSYVPTLIASTTNPTLGSGSLATATYKIQGNLVNYDYIIQFGSSGVNPGSGTYRPSVPLAGVWYGSANQALGKLYDYSSGANKYMVGEYLSVLYTDRIRSLIDILTGVIVTHASPWTWSSNDSLGGSIVYYI